MNTILYVFSSLYESAQFIGDWKEVMTEMLSYCQDLIGHAANPEEEYIAMVLNEIITPDTCAAVQNTWHNVCDVISAID